MLFDGPYKGLKSVIDFRTTRPPLSALGFYAFHVVVCVVFSSLLSGVVGLIFAAVGVNYHDASFMSITMRTAQLGADIYAVALYGFIVHTRGLLKNPLWSAGLVVAFVLAMFGGALLGIIPSGVAVGLPEDKGKS